MTEPKNERAQIERRMATLDQHIKGETERLRQMQAGWCDPDPFQSAKLRLQIGDAKKEWTALAEKLRHMATLEEKPGRSSSSSVFFGSSF